MNTSHKPLFGFTEKERLEYEATTLRLTVAAEIENYLEHAGLQAKDLAKRVRKSRPWISKLLSGRQNSTLDTLAESAWALGARWAVSLMAAERSGTPASDDPPPPPWARANQGASYQVMPHHFVPFLPGAHAPEGATTMGLVGTGFYGNTLTSIITINNPHSGYVKAYENLLVLTPELAEKQSAGTNTEISWA